MTTPEEQAPPLSRQIQDVWSFPLKKTGNTHFGHLPTGVIENLIWLYTEIGDTIFDPFAGSGIVADIAAEMGRKAWMSDLTPVREDIHEHDITTGWPAAAPDQPKLILLDPPYWRQAKGRYSTKTNDLGNQSLAEFNDSWSKVLEACIPHTQYLAFIISASQRIWRVVDHAHDFYNEAQRQGLILHRRIIVPYQGHQFGGNASNLAREKRKLLTNYRDLIVMEKPT